MTTTKGRTVAEPLPPFSGDKPTCRKCGHENAYTEYRGNGTCVHGGSGGYVGFEPNERLHRQCARCGYAWDEAPVDTTTKEDGQ